MLGLQEYILLTSEEIAYLLTVHFHMLNYRAADIVQLKEKKDARGNTVIVLEWAVSPPPPAVILSKQGERKRENKCKYQRGWDDWRLKKVSVRADGMSSKF